MVVSTSEEFNPNSESDDLISPLLPSNNSKANELKDDNSKIQSQPKFGQILPQVSCILNLSNTLMGAGMLGLPHALARSGMAVGLLLMVLSAFFSGMGLHLLARSARRVGNYPSSFFTVTHAAAPWATFLIDFAVAVKCWGVGTSYFIVIGDMLPRAMLKIDHNIGQFWVQREVWITIACIGVIPLVFAQSLNALRYTSLLSIAFILFTTALAVGYGIFLNLPECLYQQTETVSCQGNVTVSTDIMTTLNVFSIFVFSFTCQQNVFNVSNELVHCSKQQVDRVIWTTVWGSLAIYLTFSIFGYLTFGDAVESDIFDSYPSSILVTAGRIFISLMVIFSYPLQAHPCRSSLISLLRVWIRKQESTNWARFEHFAVSAVILVGSYLIALNVEDLGIVLSVIGATGSTTVTYILPGLVYQNIHFHHASNWKRLYAIFHMLLGLCIVPICLIFILFFD